MKRAIVAITIILCLIMTACASADNRAKTQPGPETESYNNNEADKTNLTQSDEDPLSRVSSLEYISIDDAIGIFSQNEILEGNAEDYCVRLKKIKNCSGKFVYQSQSSANRYIADVSFYLSYGDVFCSIDYTGYMGEIQDGKVSETTRDSFWFESFPKGDYYGREHAFTICFGNEQLLISWGSGDGHLLTRGDGSAESVQEYRENLIDSGMLDNITEVIDTYYKDVEHCVVYDEQNSVLLIIIEGMDNLRTYLSTNTKELLESWNSVADGTESLCGSIFEAVNVGNYAKHVRIYWVDSINSTNTYTKAETLLFAEDGEIVYNIVDDIESPVQITIPQQNTTVNDNISFGERNALEMAEEYLAVMPFSYSGLIEQLEYEGFSTSESVFAADHCTADWYLQAVMMAEDYLDIMSFSKSELIEQLEYEGFTHDQAVYGADKAY